MNSTFRRKGPDRNPLRFGQSIIADSETYVEQKTGKTLSLGDIARSVCEEINRQIKNTDYHFHFSNHRTQEKDSRNREQRKSATYYALYNCGVPAFGVETSKSLPIELKVRHHNLAINAFMRLMGIVPETPGLNLDPPVMKYLVISINDSLPIAVQNQQTLNLSAGDMIMVSHIEANYERGLSADIVNYGTVNDIRKKVSISTPTRIVVRKDHTPCGSIYLALNGDRHMNSNGVSVSNTFYLKPSLLLFKVEINGRERILENYSSAKLIKGDTFRLVDVISGIDDPSSLVVNFKGYVGNLSNNTGEDRGYVIDTGRDLWKRYSLDKKGRVYSVVVSRGKELVGKLLVDLDMPVFNYIVLQQGADDMVCLFPGKRVLLDPTRPLLLVDINTNVIRKSDIKAFIVNSGSFRKRLKVKEPILLSDLFDTRKSDPSSKYRILIERDKMVLGSISLDLHSPILASE